MKRLHLCHGAETRPILGYCASEHGRLGFRLQPVSRHIVLFLLISSALWLAGMTETAQAGVWHINGGTIRVGAVIRADQLTVGADGTLTGHGTIDCDVLVMGLVSPQGEAGGSISKLSFGRKLEFADSARFSCDVSGMPSETDVLNVEGPVYGSCDIVVNQAPGSVPWRNLIVSGGPGSDYAAFTVSKTGSPNCQLQVMDSKLLLTDVITDSDSDGMPDFWEQTYFSHPTSADPNEDVDGDRLTNREECLAGTEPTNVDSCLRWVQISPLKGGDLSLTWDSVEGRVYTITRSEGDLTVFKPLTNGIPASPPQNTITIRTDSAIQSLYRIQLE